MRRSHLRFAMWLGLFLAVPAQAAVIYQLDDGTRDNSVGLSGGGDLAWANRFLALPGGTSITAISVYWDSDSFPSGSPISIALWSDPNSDGSPSDAVLLGSQAGLSGSGWASYAFPSAVSVGSAGTSFFAGAFAVHPTSTYPAALDQSSAQGQSWIWFPSNNPGSPYNIDEFFSGNWMVRAESSSIGQVPEPVSSASISSSAIADCVFASGAPPATPAPFSPGGRRGSSTCAPEKGAPGYNGRGVPGSPLRVLWGEPKRQ